MMIQIYHSFFFNLFFLFYCSLLKFFILLENVISYCAFRLKFLSDNLVSVLFLMFLQHLESTSLAWNVLYKYNYLCKHE